MAIGTPVDLGHQSGTSVASNAITTLAAVANGDTIYVSYAGDASGATCTDTAGNTYLFANGGGAGTTTMSGIFYCPSALAMASSSTITVTNFTTPTRSGITALKNSGMFVNANVIRDKGIYQAGSVTSSGTATSTSKQYNALAQTAELAIECIGSLASAPGTYTPTSGFTAIGGAVSPCFINTAYKITSVGTALLMNPSWVNSVAFRAGLYCFRGAVAANTARPDMLLTGVGT